MASTPLQVDASMAMKQGSRMKRRRKREERLALIFLLEPLALAGSTDEAGVGNHPPHGRRRDLRLHLHNISPSELDDQLPAITGEAPC